MTDTPKRFFRFSRYVFAALLMAIGLAWLVGGFVEFAQRPTMLAGDGQGNFLKSPSFDALGMASAGLILSTFAIFVIARMRQMNQNDWANTCSWPHWFMLLMLLFLAIPMSIKDGNFARIRLEGWIAALFTLRWAIAAFRRERTRNWIFYCLLGILLEPAIRGTAQWLMKD